VIEDEEAIAELLCDLLQAEGATIIQMSHPSAAHDLGSDQPPDLLLMDLMLPSMDGIKLASWLRQNGLAHTPMIAMSASRIMLHFATVSSLFQAVICKPFENDDLVECIRAHVGLYVA